MQQNTMNSIVAGGVGATSLTLIHEAARHFIPNSPRVELLGMRAIRKFALRPLGLQPTRDQEYMLSIALDLISNGANYALILALGDNKRKNVFGRALLYGMTTGVATLAVPSILKIKAQPTRNHAATVAMTIAWYTLGALAAAALFNKNSEEDVQPAQTVRPTTKNGFRSHSSSPALAH